MLPLQGYRPVLLMICVFSHRVETFPSRRAMAQSGEKLLLERVVSIWGIPSELHSDRGTHFTEQIVKEACKMWPIMQYFHCTYYPQSSGLIEITNGTIKTQLAKITDAYSLCSPKALPLVLLNLRSTHFGKHHFSPFEIITGRQMRLDEDHMILHY